MHMIELPLDAAALTRFAWYQGHAASQSNGDEDFGYAAHAWLSAALGDLAPHTFRLLENRRGLRLLGYTQSNADALVEHAHTFALPEALTVCDWSSATSKEMPGKWQAARRLGFEVRACPVSRGERERDIYLAEVDTAQTHGRAPVSRADIYGAWLASQIGRDDAARAEFISLVGFRRAHCMRQSRNGQGSRHRSVVRPDALLTGELTISDPETFSNLLVRGIGRHRAFGFGMLLLRPPRGGGG